jgi:hypothetical protein
VDKPIGDLAIRELITLRERIADELLCRDVCEHGIQTGDWCPQCNTDYKAARTNPENGFEPEKGGE